MLNKIIKKYFVILAIIIFGSAFVIWSYNLIVHGVNLAKPPQFDFSELQKNQMPTPDVVWRELQAKIEEQKKLEEQQKIAEAVKEQIEKKQAAIADLKITPMTLYFTEYFKGVDYEQTQAMIDNFMSDFPWMRDLKVNDLLAQKCFVVDVPVTGRETFLADLKQESIISSIEVGESGAPEYDLCFLEKKYHQTVETWLEKYPQIIIVSSPPAVGDYIASIDLSEIYDLQIEDIEYIKKNYSDVIYLTDKNLETETIVQ